MRLPLASILTSGRKSTWMFFMLLPAEKSLAVSAGDVDMPSLKVPKRSIFTFIEFWSCVVIASTSSLITARMSERFTVQLSCMMSARSSVVTVPSCTARAYHLPLNASLRLL